MPTPTGASSRTNAEGLELPMDGVTMLRYMVDIRAVNEQLLLSGLREQALVEQLQHQLAFIHTVTNSLGEGVYALDQAGRFTFVNPAAEQLLGWTSAELIGRDEYAVIDIRPAKRSRSVGEPAPQTTLHAATPARDDALVTRRDGSSFPVAYSAAPIVTAGKVVGTVVAFRDMTQVRRLQRAQEEYLTLISHDLRAPLTAIIGRVEILLRTLLQQGLELEARSANVVVESSHRMNDMIDDLLARSRLDADQGELHHSQVDLVQLVRRMIEQTVLPAEHAPIQLEGLAQLPVIADAAQIARVISNLITNALKFSLPGGAVQVRVFQEGDRALVAITDHGGGIDPLDLPHVFEKHYRARARANIVGNGLGLYISQLIIDAHGGRLWAESRVGLGSVFTFALPLA